MAVAAAEVQHYPSRELKLTGITGTNGKTTCAYLIASIPEAAGEPVAMTGTVEYRLGNEREKSGRTHPKLRTCNVFCVRRSARLPDGSDGMFFAGDGFSSLR
jgi:UDP-N-acetylmuramyl tripeptide synthase